MALLNLLDEKRELTFCTVLSFIGGDHKQMKRYAEEILQHERRTIQVNPDGTVIIIPHPRQLPNEILARIIDHVNETLQRYSYRRVGQQHDLLVGQQTIPFDSQFFVMTGTRTGCCSLSNATTA